MVLPKFRLAIMQIKSHQVAEHKGGPEQPGSQTRGGADCWDTTELKQGGHRDLAYVLHTSGTTGLPKTVRVPHKCILPNILHLRSV